jgi:hypothetical protein
MNTNGRIMVLVLLVVSLSVAESGSCNDQQLENIIANSVSGFSGTQGSNGWWYGYWDQSADDDKFYGQKDDFRLLGRFGDDRVNGLSQHTEFTTGKLWYLEDGKYYTSIWAEGGHILTARWTWASTQKRSIGWCAAGLAPLMAVSQFVAMLARQCPGVKIGREVSNS